MNPPRVHARRRTKAPPRTERTAPTQDPTRTTVLRARWVRDVRARWADLNRAIVETIVVKDCFGIQPSVLGVAAADSLSFVRGDVLVPPIHVRRRAQGIARAKAFQFGTTSQKVDAFMSWLERQEAAGVLEIVRRPGQALGSGVWSDVYVQTSYRKGILRGKREMKQSLREAGIRVDRLYPDTGREVAGAFLQPVHAERIGVVYSRTFEKLKTATMLTNDRIRTELLEGLTDGLARGIAEGKSPRVIAREIARKATDAANVVGRHRMTLIARTEVIAAHHKATMGEYRLAERELAAEGWDVKLDVKAEMSTAANPCPECDYLSTFTYTLDEAEGLIPVHPQCRCAVIPRIVRRDASSEAWVGSAESPVSR